MSDVHVVDREDQVRWYVDESSCHDYCVQLDNNHKALRDWLVGMCQHTVVISGKGVMPRCGTEDHPGNVYASIQRKQFRIYFQDLDDAMAFKLAWGGLI